MKHRVGLAMCVLVIGVGAVSAGDEPRKDALGDPLPARALIRLGTARWKAAEYVADLAFSPDDAYLFSSGVRVQKWDVKTGQAVATYPAHFGEMIALSPDGKSMLVGGDDRPLRVVDVTAGKIARTFLKQPCDRAVFSPDGRTVLCILENGKTLALYGFALAQERRRYEGAAGRLRHAVFSSDGKFIAAVSPESDNLRDGAAHITIWEAATSKLRTRIVSKTHGLTYDVAFTSDNRRLLVGSRQGIHVFDTENGKPIDVPGLDAKGHVAVEPKGRWALVGFEGIRWDLANDRKLGQLTPARNQIGARAISHDGKIIATAQSSVFHETIDLWDAATGELKTPADRHRAEVDEVAFSPVGKTLATRSVSDGAVKIWDRETGKPQQTFQWGDATLFAYGTFGFAQRGQIVLAGGRRWDVKTGKPTRDVVEMTDAKEREGKAGADTRRYQFLHVSPDGRFAADLDFSQRVRVWDVAGDRVFFRIDPIAPAASGAAIRCTFTADSQAIVVVQDVPDVLQRRKDPIRVIDIATQKVRAAFGKESNGISAVLCTPDGSHLIALTQTGLEVRAMGTGQFIRRLEARPRSAALTISANGRLLAFESEKAEVTLVEVASGGVVDAWPTAGSFVQSLAFSADGHYLVTGHRDSTALVWDLEVPNGNRIVREKTDAELWDALMRDAAEAHRVVSALSHSQWRAISILERRLTPDGEPTAKQVAGWLKDLGEPAFAKRDSAVKQLLNHGPFAAPYLRDALKEEHPLETRRLMESLLRKVEAYMPPPERLRDERALQILEMIATPESQILLTTLAKGAAGSQRTRGAKAALERLQAR